MGLPTLMDKMTDIIKIICNLLSLLYLLLQLSLSSPLLIQASRRKERRVCCWSSKQLKRDRRNTTVRTRWNVMEFSEHTFSPSGAPLSGSTRFRSLLYELRSGHAGGEEYSDSAQRRDEREGIVRICIREYVRVEKWGKEEWGEEEWGIISENAEARRRRAMRRGGQTHGGRATRKRPRRQP